MPTPPSTPADVAAALARLPKPSPTRCPDCMRRVRKPSQTAAEWPGTVCYTDSEGRCPKCRRARQTAIIEADAARRAEEEAVEREAAERAAAIAAWEAAAARVAAEKASVVPVPDEAAAATVEQLEPEQPARPARHPKSVRTVACSSPGCPEKVAPYSRSGLCSAHRGGNSQPVEKPQPVRDANGLTEAERHTRRALDSFLAARYRRGVRPEGNRNDDLAHSA